MAGRVEQIVDVLAAIVLIEDQLSRADSSGRRNRICWPTGRHRKPTSHLPTWSTRFGIAAFDGIGGSTLDKHSAVLGLVQDEPTLRAGAASGILDKTCARRSDGGRSAPRNGPLCLTKECNLDLGSEAIPNTVSSGRRWTWPISAIGQVPLPAFAKQAFFGALR